MSISNRSWGHREYWDRAGMGASLLCVLHCVLTPFVVGALPVLAATERQTHSLLAIAIVLMGMLAFIPGYYKHRRKSIPAKGVIGAALITAAVLLPETAGAETIETLLVLAGGVMLVAAHWRNAYWCRYCKLCQDIPCQRREQQEVYRLSHE